MLSEPKLVIPQGSIASPLVQASAPESNLPPSVQAHDEIPALESSQNLNANGQDLPLSPLSASPSTSTKPTERSPGGKKRGREEDEGGDPGVSKVVGGVDGVEKDSRSGSARKRKKKHNQNGSGKIPDTK